jgi:hypothetical protein
MTDNWFLPNDNSCTVRNRPRSTTMFTVVMFGKRPMARLSAPFSAASAILSYPNIPSPRAAPQDYT